MLAKIQSIWKQICGSETECLVLCFTGNAPVCISVSPPTEGSWSSVKKSTDEHLQHFGNEKHPPFWTSLLLRDHMLLEGMKRLHQPVCPGWRAPWRPVMWNISPLSSVEKRNLSVRDFLMFLQQPCHFSPHTGLNSVAKCRCLIPPVITWGMQAVHPQIAWVQHAQASQEQCPESRRDCLGPVRWLDANVWATELSLRLLS